MAKKKTTKSNEIDYSDTRNPIELYLAKAIGENVTLPDTDNERILVYLRKLIEVIEQSGGGTEVIANPALAGTEDALTGLQVGETKYKVDTKLYRHVFSMGTIIGAQYIEFRNELITRSPDKVPHTGPLLTLATLANYIELNGELTSTYFMFRSYASNSGGLADAIAYPAPTKAWTVFYYDNSTSAYTSGGLNPTITVNENVYEIK